MYRRLVNKINYLVNYLRCFFVARYNVIKLRRLPVTWTDRDVIMYHFLFQLVEDFVEKEEPFGPNFSREAMIEHVAFLLSDSEDCRSLAQWERSVEIIDIYSWIKTDFASYEKRLKDLYVPQGSGMDPLEFSESDLIRYSQIELEESTQDSKIEEMLWRIVKIRQSLWT